MSISGLVLTLSDDADARSALDRLAADARLTLGERFGRRLAVVAETPDAHADAELFDRLRSTPGIVGVDVAYVHLDASPARDDRSGRPRAAEVPHGQP